MISGIHLSTSEVVVQNKSGSHPVSGFKRGQKVLAKILSRSPDGLAQLLINGRQLSAKTPMLLKPGQEVMLQVVQEKDATVFKFLGPARSLNTSEISRLAAFFSKNTEFPDMTADSRMKDFGALLKEIAVKSGTADQSFLPRLIEKSGLMWEKKLVQYFSKTTRTESVIPDLARLSKSDIKAMLIEQGMTSGGEKAGVSQAGTSFLETLENFQMLNRNTMETGRFLLPFPVFSDQQFQFGQLLIDTGDNKKEKGKKDRMIRVSFLLNMTRLGPVRADFSILKNEIAGQFLVARENICEYVTGGLPDLKERLSRIDYQVRAISCSVAQPEQIEQSALMEQVLRKEDSQVLSIMA